MLNLLTIAKVLPGVDVEVDAIVAAPAHPRDLLALVDPARTGRGVLYFACWRDPWLTGDDLNPDDWRWPIPGRELAAAPDGWVWELSLTDTDADALQRAARPRRKLAEQRWLLRQLWQAFESFEDQNADARLLYARQVLNVSLNDHQVLGEGRDDGASG